jgi:hypothetical protein
MPFALTDVRFEEKNGHDAGVTPFPLMTQSGHFAGTLISLMPAVRAQHPTAL